MKNLSTSVDLKAQTIPDGNVIPPDIQNGLAYMPICPLSEQW